MNRVFRAPAPNMPWLSDFTGVATRGGFAFVALAIVLEPRANNGSLIDAFARRIVGWRVSRVATAEFVLDALDQALHQRHPFDGGRLVRHSDRGSQYVIIRYTERLAEAGIEPSVGGVGDSYDNALAETVIGLFKTEVTLATGAIYTGIALLVRPVPGGEVSLGLGDAFTGALFGLVPTAVVVVVLATLLWSPIRRHPLGRSIAAVGSAELAAENSGLSVARARIMAYGLGGFFAALAGLFIGFQTLSGDASIGLTYTLNSIAAVVIGGTLLSGGAGSAWGSVAGALVLRTIGSLVFFMGLEPLAQPLFEGLVLMAAVSFGAFRLLRIENRLEIFR